MGLLMGFVVRDSGLAVSHMQYADDTLLIGGANGEKFVEHEDGVEIDVLSWYQN